MRLYPAGGRPSPGKEAWGYVDVREGAHMFWWLYYADPPSYQDLPLVLWLQVGLVLWVLVDEALLCRSAPISLLVHRAVPGAPPPDLGTLRKSVPWIGSSSPGKPPG